jgi:chromosome segregation ATPase
MSKSHVARDGNLRALARRLEAIKDSLAQKAATRRAKEAALREALEDLYVKGEKRAEELGRHAADKLENKARSYTASNEAVSLSIELHAHMVLLRLDKNVHDTTQSLHTMGARLEAVEKGQVAMEKRMQTMEKTMQTIGTRLEAVEKGQTAMEKPMQKIETTMQTMQKMQTQQNMMLCVLAVLAAVILAK